MTRRDIESYSVTLYPTTLELIAQWLDNGSDLNEMDYWRAQWAKALYERRRYMDLTFEPFALSVTLNMAGILLTAVEGRLEAVDSMLAYNGPNDPDNSRLLAERTRLLDDQRAILNLPI